MHTIGRNVDPLRTLLTRDVEASGEVPARMLDGEACLAERILDVPPDFQRRCAGSAGILDTLELTFYGLLLGGVRTGFIHRHFKKIVLRNATA
jgi:hypothetical protein